MEEAQHAMLDTLMVEAIAAGLSTQVRAEAVDGYISLGGMIDGALKEQVELDLEAFTRATGRVLDESERERFVAVQHQAQRWTFIGSGMSHPKFLGTVGALVPEGRQRLESIAPAFS
jgi:DNA-binding MurR/RpiR family transcriptional regulator